MRRRVGSARVSKGSICIIVYMHINADMSRQPPMNRRLAPRGLGQCAHGGRSAPLLVRLGSKPQARTQNIVVPAYGAIPNCGMASVEGLSERRLNAAGKGPA